MISLMSRLGLVERWSKKGKGKSEGHGKKSVETYNVRDVRRAFHRMGKI